MRASRVMDGTRTTARCHSHKAAIDSALAELQSLESPCTAVITGKHWFKRKTLSRRWRGANINRAQAAEDKRFLKNQQVSDLYSTQGSSAIDAAHLYQRPQSMVESRLAGKPPGGKCCSRSAKRHGAALD